MNSDKSLRKIENRIGERFSPCRTPMLLTIDSDLACPIRTHDLALAYKRE